VEDIPEAEARIKEAMTKELLDIGRRIEEGHALSEADQAAIINVALGTLNAGDQADK